MAMVSRRWDSSNIPEWGVIPTIVLSDSTHLDDIKSSHLLGASSYHINRRKRVLVKIIGE